MTMMAWKGGIVLQNGHVLESVSLENDRGQAGILPSGSSLRFLSSVETKRIPLYLSIGSTFTVSTTSSETESWFSHILLSNASTESQWWKGAALDSALGILVAVDHPVNPALKTKPRATEVLFYASAQPGLASPYPSPPAQDDVKRATDRPIASVKALVLSSDLLDSIESSEPTPPSSPQEASFEATFLPEPFPQGTEIINEPPVRKRKTASDAFDEATERRRKARRKGGEGVAVAAAPKAEKNMPTLQHRRSASNTYPAPLQNRALSRSPSIASSRPPTANRPSALSKVESASNANESSTFESSNKDTISRVVMTGMRLYGLVQSKRRKSRANSEVPSAMIEEASADLEAERKADDEYKLIYHQVFKSTCFAFRRSIGQENLQPYSTKIRDVVDQLLSILTTDPMEIGLGGSKDKLTPGGRKAFAESHPAQNESPF